MKIIASESWSWMLFEHEQSLFLSVVCGSVGLYTRDFALSESERQDFAAQGRDFIDELANRVSFSSKGFDSRHLADFQKMPGQKEAVDAWNAQRSAAPSSSQRE